MDRYLSCFEIIKLTVFAKALLVLFFFFPSVSYAADAATIVFKSGQVVKINDGFKDVSAAMRELNNKSQEHRVVQLELNGGTFLLNVAEVVIVCRDDCRGLDVVDVRDPARAQQGGGR